MQIYLVKWQTYCCLIGDHSAYRNDKYGVTKTTDIDKFYLRTLIVIGIMMMKKFT